MCITDLKCDDFSALEDFDLGRNIQKLRNRRIYVIKSGSQESPSGSTLETTLDLSGPEPLGDHPEIQL